MNIKEIVNEVEHAQYLLDQIEAEDCSMAMFKVLNSLHQVLKMMVAEPEQPQVMVLDAETLKGFGKNKKDEAQPMVKTPPRTSVEKTIAGQGGHYL